MTVFTLSCTVDSSKIIIPFDPKETCPLSFERFDVLIKSHSAHKIPRPYVLAVIPKTAQTYSFFDAEHLHTRYELQNFTNPETGKTCEKVHYFVLKTIENGFSFLKTCSGKVRKCVLEYTLASSLFSDQSVHATRELLLEKFYNKANYIEAQYWARLILAFNPDNFRALLTLGHIYYYGVKDILRDTKKACSYYERAVKIAPYADSIVYANLASLYCNAEESEGWALKAFEYLKQAVKKDPSNSKAWALLGFLFVTENNEIEKDLQRAFSYVEKALKLNPKNPLALETMGQLLY
ncbi:MAG: Tetratricopeptide 1 repeat-containing protein, partial [Chlamydiia bacterium]|nr:Tetratricopeptide 1 repeat-containing protein [Chlamydiia bacterium]